MNNRLPSILCYLIITVFAMVLTSYSPLLSYISETFSLSLSQSGIIFTANFVGFVVFTIIGGILADKLGKKNILSISVAGFALALLLFPLSGNFYIACITMGLIGGFGGIIESILNAVISDINPENPSFHINLLQVFFGIGAVIGPFLAGLLVSSDIAWQVFYYILGLISLVFSGILIAIKIPQLHNADSISWIYFKALLSDRKFLLICLCMALYTGSEVGSWGWMSTSLKEGMGFSITKAGIAVGVFWSSMTIGRFLCGHLTLKYSLRSIIITLSLLSSVFVLLSGLRSSEILLWFVIVALGFSFSSQWPLIASYGSEHYKASSGTVFAILVASGGLGTTIIPYLMGVIGEQANLQLASVSPAIFFIAIAFIFIFIDKLDSKLSN